MITLGPDSVVESPRLATVEDLLAQAYAAHIGRQRASGSIDRDGNPGAPDYPTAEDQSVTMARALLAAQALDPDRLDPAWVAFAPRFKQVPYDTLLAFHAKYVRTDPISAQAKQFAEVHDQTTTALKDAPDVDVAAIRAAVQAVTPDEKMLDEAVKP